MISEESDYYPGGMLMPSRIYSVNNSSYRYGFNGKERDSTITNQDYDYGFRIYDARVMRFLTVDPLQKNYPWYTPYQFSGNSPIANIDLDGLEEYYYSALWNNKTGKVELKLEKTVDQKSFLGIKWTPAKEIIVTFNSSDGDKTNYSFTPEGHIVRNNGTNEHVNTIASFEAFKKGSADKVYSSEDDAKFDFGGDGGTGGFYSNGALAWNFVGNASKDFYDHGGAYTLNAKINTTVASANGGTTAEEGVLEGANFAQNKINKQEVFSAEGQQEYSKIAGTPIKTVNDLTTAIRNGKVNPSQIPLDYVVVNGTKVILNTRTSTALNRANIPMSKWYGINQTGVSVPGMTNIKFDDLAAQQTKNSNLPATGTSNAPK